MTEKKFERTTNKELYTPAIARKTAMWAIKSAETTVENSDYALITARVFTAFMVEGVIQHIGAQTYRDWKKDRKTSRGSKKPSLERSGFVDQHKFIRKRIGLTNSSQDYREAQDLFERLMNFRDQFAHPKLINHPPIKESVSSRDERLPDIAWENDVKLDIVKPGFKTAENYCISLLKDSAQFLESEHRKGQVYCLEHYPHHHDLEHSAVSLRLFLDRLSSSMSSTVAGNDG